MLIHRQRYTVKPIWNINFKGTKPKISSSLSLGSVSIFSNCGPICGKTGIRTKVQSCLSIQMRNQSHDFPPNIVKELLSSSWCHCIPCKGTFSIFCTRKCHHKPNSLVGCTLIYIYCCQNAMKWYVCAILECDTNSNSSQCSSGEICINDVCEKGMT